MMTTISEKIIYYTLFFLSFGVGIENCIAAHNDWLNYKMLRVKAEASTKELHKLIQFVKDLRG